MNKLPKFLKNTFKEFEPKAFAAELSKFGSFVVDQADRGAISGEFIDIRCIVGV